jgi:hypothetical protein
MIRKLVFAALCVALLPAVGAAQAPAEPRPAWAYVPAPATPAPARADWLAGERAPAERTPARRPGLGARVRQGALLGAGLGTLTGLGTLLLCGSYCEGNAVQGVALHVGVGAAFGATAGVMMHTFGDRY